MVAIIFDTESTGLTSPHVIEAAWLLTPILLRMDGVATWEEVWVRSEQARIPKVMMFGKHKGAAISQIPADYKRWLLGQPELDPYLVKALLGEAA